jgi:hypothetical protein
MHSFATRINFTNRLRIEKSAVRISARHPEDGAKPTIRLERLDLPDNGVTIHGGAPWLTAEVWLEAWRIRTNSYCRVLIGKVSDLQSLMSPAIGFSPESFADFWGASYRIKVVSADKRILAQADNLKSDEDTPVSHAELIQVYPEELGEQVWRIDWTDMDNGPRVLVNKKLPNPADFLSTNAMVAANVLPSIVREVLQTIGNLTHSGAVASYEWPQRWLAFVETFYSTPPDFEADELLVLSWIDDAIAAFCAYNKFFSSLEAELHLDEEN